VVRDSLPYAWEVISAAVEDQAARSALRPARGSAAFGAGTGPAAAGSGQRRYPWRPGAPLRCRAGIPEPSQRGRIRPLGGVRSTYQALTNPRNQILTQRPELRDC